jgi:cellobiose transport system substrate-binding protein
LITKSRRLSRLLVAAGAVAAAALLATACSSGGSGGSQVSASAKQTITIGLYGTFGYKEAGLYADYEKLHPNITIEEDDVATSAAYWTRLKTRLASGTGLDDVQAIEMGFVADVTQNHADQFVNFAAQPDAAQLKSEFYAWKWKLASTPDGKQTIGLGVDAAPVAMCYRPDMLKAAGLSTDPDELAAQWKTWEGYIAFGKKYQASSTKPAGSSFVDSAASIFVPSVGQGSQAYDNAQGQPDLDNAPGVNTAWNFATEAATSKITAGLVQFTPSWNSSFTTSKFATIACPSWMMGYIQTEMGPSGSGKWAVAPVLPGGGANQGGSFLAVPKASDHQAAAIQFAEWLTSKQQQITMWQKGGLFPSNQLAAADPAVTADAPAYFSKSPIGTIYNNIASSMKLPPVGVYDSQIATVFTTQLNNVETAGTSPSKAYSDALAAIKQITG